MHRGVVKEASRRDRADCKVKSTVNTACRSASRHTATAARPLFACGDNDDDPVVDDEALRARVRRRIQERVLELHAAEGSTATLIEVPQPFMGALHHDVVQTAAQILGKYLASAHPGAEPLELTLVHRMLAKEVELQALQLQRASVHQ